MPLLILIVLLGLPCVIPLASTAHSRTKHATIIMIKIAPVLCVYVSAGTRMRQRERERETVSPKPLGEPTAELSSFAHTLLVSYLHRHHHQQCRRRVAYFVHFFSSKTEPHSGRTRDGPVSIVCRLARLFVCFFVPSKHPQVVAQI